VATDRHEDLASMLRALRGTNTTTVQINAGGVGVWLCTTALAVVCALSVVFVVVSRQEAQRRDMEMTEMRRDVQTLRDYLAAIYASAPHLKPEESK
jgi:uncharacterized membrane protein